MKANMVILENVHKQCEDFEKSIYDAKLLTARLKKASMKVADGLHELGKIVSKRNDYCNICFEHQRKIAFVPCGHCCCISCSEQLADHKCFICRQTVTSMQRIYL
jgi:hypothetical protein